MSKSTETATRSARKPRSTKTHPTPEEIQARAYELYLQRHGAPGDPLEDWVRAERELLESNGTKTRQSARSSKQEAA